MLALLAGCVRVFELIEHLGRSDSQIIIAVDCIGLLKP